MSFTDTQKDTIIITERVGSAISLCGAAYVILTFLVNDKFRKPINRLVVYASFGNILASVAALISTSGISAGINSPLCQVQGFLLQWFMPADTLWTFAMALNVYLSFFHSYDTAQLHRIEPKYLIGCYGLPLIPAFSYLFMSTMERGKVYGSAMLWCWIDIKWEFLRIATFYGPVWLVIISTFAIYIKVGALIFKWRKQLVNLNRFENDTASLGDVSSSQTMKTCEVAVTTTCESTINLQRNDKVTCYSKTPAAVKKGLAKTQLPQPTRIDPNKAALKYTKCAVLFFVALLNYMGSIYGQPHIYHVPST